MSDNDPKVSGEKITTLKSWEEARKFLEEAKKSGNAGVLEYMAMVEQATGHHPQKPLDPLAVYEIARKAARDIFNELSVEK